MQWWPGVPGPWITLGRIDVDGMAQGAIQIGQNLNPRGSGGGGGSGSSITLVNATGDFANGVVWFGYISSVSVGQGAGAQGAGALAAPGANPRPAGVPSAQAGAERPVYTFHFPGNDVYRYQPGPSRHKSRRK